LLTLLASVAVLGVAWALLVPAWQSPDENAHFGYAQTVAENHRLPGVKPGHVFSAEQRRGAAATDSDQVAANPLAKPNWGTGAFRAYERAPGGARGDGGGREGKVGPSNPARVNPPVYYVYEAIPYYAASGGSVFDRLYLMRIWSVLLLLVSVVATWLLIAELLGPRPLLQLAGATVVGLQPMAMFLSASVTPDGLLNAASALVLWLGVSVLRRGLTLPRGAALCGALAAAILAKATAYALVPATLFALGLGVARLPTTRQRVAALVPALALGGPVGLWLLLTRLAGRPAVNQIGSGSGTHRDIPGLVSYVWQYYLPHLPFQRPLPSVFAPIPAWEIWLKGGWARFGWLEVTFPGVVYAALLAVTVVIVAAGGVALARSGVRRHWAVVAFFGVAAIGLFGGLHLTEYRAFRNQGLVINQGRYLLPLLPALGAAAAAALTILRPTRRAMAAGALVAGMFVLQLGSLALIAGRFYA
jgi:hypothetical protein